MEKTETPDVSFQRSIEAIFALRRSIDGVFFKSFFSEWNNPLQISQSHLLTLILLSFQDHCPMSRISDQLGLEKGSFTAVAGKLLDLALIRRQRNKKDRRIYLLSLTRAGRDLAEQAKADHIRFIHRRLDRFDPQARTRYLKAVEDLLEMTRELSEAAQG